MRLIIRNIINFARTEILIFIIMSVCVFTSAFILDFSYGLYQNYHVILVEGNSELRDVNPVIQEAAVLTKGEFQRFIEALKPETQNSIALIYAAADLTQIGFEQEKSFFPMRFCVYDGSYCVPSEVRKIWEGEGLIIAGRYLSDEEEAVGARVAIIPEENTSGEIGGMVKYLGQDYLVVGTYKAGSLVPLVPFLTVPDDLVLENCSFRFVSTISRSAYEDLKGTAASVIPGCLTFPDIPIADSDSIYLYHNIILISLLISVLSVMNFAMLYLFIVRKREKTFAVFRICGARRIQIVFLCLGECTFITVPIFWLGSLSFKLLLKLFFIPLFPYMAEAFRPVVYLAIFILYMLVMFIIVGLLIWKNTSKSIREGMEEIV